MSQQWYEDAKWTHIGMLETGKHSIYEFEVFVDEQSGEVAFCDHDDPDDPMSLNSILTFDMERGLPRDEVSLQAQFVKFMVDYYSNRK